MVTVQNFSFNYNNQESSEKENWFWVFSSHIWRAVKQYKETFASHRKIAIVKGTDNKVSTTSITFVLISG